MPSYGQVGSSDGNSRTPPEIHDGPRTELGRFEWVKSVDRAIPSSDGNSRTASGDSRSTELGRVAKEIQFVPLRTDGVAISFPNTTTLSQCL
jgi:hypothetical protein